MSKRKWIPPSARVSDTPDPEVVKSLLGQGVEKITDDLIKELLAKNPDWKEADLRDFQKQDFRYNRNRNSFFSPPVGEGSMKHINGWPSNAG